MSKAKGGAKKVASRNNPAARERTKKYFFGGKEVKPVKLVMLNSTFFGAEYEGSGEVVMGSDGTPTPWAKVRSESTAG